MATFTFYLKKDKKPKGGKYPVYFRIFANGTSRYLFTDLYLSPEHWNNKSRRVRSSHPRHQQYNNELERLRHEAEGIHMDHKSNGGISPGRIRQIMTGPDAQEFFVYAESYMKNIQNDGLVRRHKQTKVICNKIESLHGSRDGLMLSDIDPSFLESLQSYLADEYDNAPNTIRKDFERLKMLLREARRDGMIQVNPFVDFNMPKKQKGKKTALSYSQIQDLEALEIKEEPELWDTRNYFLFSFYCAGIRFGDLCRLKRKNIVDGHLVYTMAKTKDSSEPDHITFPLHSKTLAILEAYNYRDKEPGDFLFPIVNPVRDYSDPFVWDREKQSRTTIANRHLKELASRAGIESNLTTHVARHSFASDMKRREILDIYEISKALGHSKVATTETYMKSFDKAAVYEKIARSYE